MTVTIATPIIANGTVTLSGDIGVAAALPVAVNIGAAFGTTTDTDATGAWTISCPESILSPGTYSVVAEPQPLGTATTTLTIAYPPGLTMTEPPVVVGTMLAPNGTPSIVGAIIGFPFTGAWSATLSTIVTLALDGVNKNTGWYGPTGPNNVCHAALSWLTPGPHTVEISITSPAAASVTWDFVYEPPAPSSGGGTGGGTTTTPPAPALVTRPDFPPTTTTGQLGSVMQRANGAATPAAITTCGLTFKQGVLPKGSGVTLGGVPAQIDVPTTWPDKSARFAVLTAKVPALAADAPIFPMLATAPVMAGQSPSLTIPTGAVTIDLTIGGVDYAYDVGTMLAGVMPDWLNGPLAVQGRITQVVTGFLRLMIDVRCHADGSWNVVVGFNGDLAFEATSPAAVFTEIGEIIETKTVYGWQSLVLSATVKQAGTVVKQVTNLTQYQYTTWHVEVDSRAAVPEMLFDVAQHIASGLMPRFNLSGVDETTIAGYYSSMTAANGFGTPSTPPATVATGYYPDPVPTLGWDGHTLYMGTTGGRSDIGQATDPCCAWAITYDPRMSAYCLAQAEGIASAPWHLFVRANNRYINTIDQPELWTALTQIQQGKPSLPTDQQIYGSPWALDPAHQPNACLIPYLLTGEPHYLDEILAQASWTVMAVNARGLLTGDLVVNQGQGRGMAWGFRQIFYASQLAADNDPLLPWLTDAVAHNIAALNAINTTAQGELAMYWCYPNGLTGPNDAVPGTTILAPWQNDFQQLALTVAVDCGIAGAAEALSKAAGFTAGRFISSADWFRQDGFDYYYETSANGVLIATWAALKAIQIANGDSTNGNEAILPPNCSLQYVAYAVQTLTQMARVLAAAGYTAQAALCTEALAFVVQQANVFGAGLAFAQANPSFAITG
jgi:hypothetical protein